MKDIPRLADLDHPLDPRIMPPQQMLLEIAGGMEEPEAVAMRYGYTQRTFRQLRETDAYKQQVIHYEAELRATGVTFARKAAMLAEDLLVDVYQMAKGSHDPDQVLKAAQFMAKMGRLEPVAKEASGGGAGNAGGSAVFAISFNFGSGTRREDLVIDNAVVRELNLDLGVTDVESHAVGSGIGGS
jgi:hypothetical protein